MIKTILKKHFSLITTLLIVGIVIWKIMTPSPTNTAQDTLLKPVHVETVSETEFQPTEDFSGFVGGVRQAVIAPKISGYVVSLLKEPGESVRAGETIAILDGNELAAEGQSANENLTSALKSLQQTKKYYEQTVSEAEARLSKIEESRDRGEATSKDVSVAKESVQSAKKLRDAENARSESSVTAARGGTVISKAFLQNAFIKAPFSGIITEKQTTLGSFVNAGSPLYTLAEPSELEIAVSVPARMARYLQKGMPVVITPEHSAHLFSGFIFSVASAVQKNTGETTVRVRFIERDVKKLPLLGEYGSVTFPTEPSRESILVPDSSLVRAYDDTFVFVLENGTAQKKSVTLGGRSKDRTEILSGLNVNDSLIIEGTQGLQNGIRVSEY